LNQSARSTAGYLQ
jgi:hypothetical protein